MALCGSDSRGACTRALQSQAVIRLSVCVSDVLTLSISFDFVNHIQHAWLPMANPLTEIEIIF